MFKNLVLVSIIALNINLNSAQKCAQKNEIIKFADEEYLQKILWQSGILLELNHKYLAKNLANKEFNLEEITEIIFESILSYMRGIRKDRLKIILKETYKVILKDKILNDALSSLDETVNNLSNRFGGLIRCD